MTRLTTILMSVIFAVTAAAADITFSGNQLKPISIDVEASTGLDGLYVLNGVTGVSMSFTLPQGATGATWSKFDYMGAAYAQPIEASLVSTSGGVTTISTIEGDMGYAINYGTDTYYVWIVDYSAHPFSITDLSLAQEQDCSTTNLSFAGSAERITYYSITARALELNRDITLTYYTLERDESRVAFVQTEKEISYSYLTSTIHAPAALCDTRFTLAGDRFLREWGQELSLSTSSVSAHAVDLITTANQETRTSDNEIKTETTLGGSAPVTIEFKSAISDAAVYHEWQMSRDAEFYDIFYRNTDLDFTYTFNEMGTIYVRLLIANASGDCEMECDPYQVYIGESQLLCPNAFSPGSTIGVNDEWRVSYKSIISFECYIFDRWGTKMFEFHDPAQGWDGKYKGKLVPAGVYYYVIKARGSDGKNYNLSGDINILKSNR